MELYIKKFSELSNQELYKIIEARINIFVVEQDCPYTECDNKDQQSYHLYYKTQGEITAYLRLIPAGISYKEASIGRVLVKKDFRRNNLGTKLMKKSLDYAKNELNINTIRISAQEYVLDFYKKLGFKVISDKYLEDGIPHFEMINKL